MRCLRRLSFAVCLVLLASLPAAAFAADGGGEVFTTTAGRSPGLAAALSLTPMPIDFGNLYAENVDAGIAWTAVEVGLMGAMMWSADGDHWGMHSQSGGQRWTQADRDRMGFFVGSYVIAKLASSFHAAHSAQRHNDRAARVGAFVAPLPGGAIAGVGTRF